MTAVSKKKLAVPAIKKELSQIARIGQMFVDGDLCRQMWMPHSETYRSGDDMDYNPATTVPIKKTLLRLERLCPFACGTTLWRRRPDFPDAGEAVLFGMHGSPQGGDKPPRGYVPPKLTKELESVFLKGEQAWRLDGKSHIIGILMKRGVSVRSGDGKPARTLQLFVPVKDSMGDIAAALEVFTVITG